MTTAETVPDVEVDESELTQQPCRSQRRRRRADPWVRCVRPAVGEDVSTCLCGHVGTLPLCDTHIGCRNTSKPGRGPICITCEHAGCTQGHRRWLIVSRLYTRRPA